MPERFTYKEHEVAIEVEAHEPRLRVNGDLRPIQQDADTNAFVSPDAPYIRYGTIEELARAIIDADIESKQPEQ